MFEFLSFFWGVAVFFWGFFWLVGGFFGDGVFFFFGGKKGEVLKREGG